MIVVTPSTEEMQAAGRVASSAELDAVRLVSVAARNRGVSPEAKDNALEAALSFRLVRFGLVPVDRFEVTTSLRLELTTHDRQGQPAAADGVLEIEVEFLTAYKLPATPIPADVSEHGLPAFARFNALFNCWPYVRQEVQQVIGGMGLPPFVLPTLVIRARKPDSVPDEPVAGAPAASSTVKRNARAGRRL